MIKNLIKVFFVLILTALEIQIAGANDLNSERVIWDKKPISVMLHVNDERIINFPLDVRYWLPESIEKSVTILSANGVIYIKALEKFKKTRIRVQELETQHVYLLDLIAIEDEKNMIPSELVVMNREYIKTKSKEANTSIKKGDWFVRLTRFSSRSLYGVERLMPNDADIYQVNINSVNSVPLVRGGDIEAIPVASWKGAGLYVTAVRLRNLSEKTIPINLNKAYEKGRSIYLDTDIRGNWLAVTPQHTFINSMGSDEDTTCLYLISDRPFEESL